MVTHSEQNEYASVTAVINRYLLWLPLTVIRVYRYLISPLTGNQCRFYPTCATYSEAAYQRFGLFGGTRLTIKRLLRCHPWHAGGVDFVPEKAGCLNKRQHHCNHD